MLADDIRRLVGRKVELELATGDYGAVAPGKYVTTITRVHKGRGQSVTVSPRLPSANGDPPLGEIPLAVITAAEPLPD